MKRDEPHLKRTHSVGVSGGDLVVLGTDEPDADEPERTVGFAQRYETLALIGSGGMGEVRLCRDRTVGREVAMKVMRERVGSSPRRWRFVREARVQGQLEHPAVVPLYDIGIDPEGNLYFTMKRVRGVSLADVIGALASGDPAAQRRYSRRRLLTVFSQVCLAVGFIHTRGVVHRDLKPDNVMLGEFGEVYLLDWGLAKILESFEPEPLVDAIGANTTGQGSVLGTPGYMSPEQLRGEVDRIDGRSDVYSLGVLLYEMMALEPLHPRGNMQEKLLSVLQTDGARPGARRSAGDVDPALDDIVERATRLEPDARYATAGALSEAIESYLDRLGG